MLVDDIFAVGLKSRYDVLRDEFNLMIHVKNLRGLRWYVGYHYTRERERGTLTKSQIMFDNKLVRTICCVTSEQSVPLQGECIELAVPRVSQYFDVASNTDASRQLKCSASCCEILYSAESYPLPLGILGYIKGAIEYGITWYQSGTLASVSLEVFADANYAPNATVRRSVSGGAIMYGCSSVYWFSRTQKYVTSSAREATLLSGML